MHVFPTDFENRVLLQKASLYMVLLAWRLFGARPVTWTYCSAKFRLDSAHFKPGTQRLD